ncbi:MAG: hypothetical protein AAF171_11550 [Cyanobacteria bacterium P01_A01_bin.116]
MNKPTLKNNHKWLALSAVTLAVTGAVAPSAEAANFTLDFDSGVINGESILMTDENTLVTDQWADWGLANISGYNNRTKKAARLNLYNTDASGQDNDLRTGSGYGTASQGNVLIIQEEDRKKKSSHKDKNLDYLEKNGQYRADDEAWGGYIDFDFAESVAFKSFSLLDIDDDARHNGKHAHKRIKVEGYDSNNNKVLNIDVDELIEQHRADQSITGNDAAAAQGTSFEIDGVTITQVGTKRNDNSMYRFDIDEALLSAVRFTYPGSGAISGLKWSTEDEPRDIPEPSAIGGLLMIGFVGSRKYLKRKQSASDLNA